MKHTLPTRVVIAVVFAAIFPTASSAVVIRADRDPQLYLDLAQSPAYASAGLFRITRDVPGFSGSGVLVGNQWVLTAAHLLTGTTDMTFAVGGQDYAASGWVAHKKFDGNLRNGYDLALVRLATPVEGIAPAILNRSKKEQNAIGTFVGFGRTGDGITGGQPIDQVDFLGRAGTNVIDGTADLKLGYGKYKPKLTGSARTFVVDFDNPANAAGNSTGSPDPTDLESLIAQGDSGGPVFIDFGKGDGPVLAGINSFGEFRDERDDSDYGDITGHTRVAKFRSWINQTTKRGDLGKTIPDFVTAANSATARELGPVRVTVVPEPSGLGVLAMSVVALIRRRRRQLFRINKRLIAHGPARRK